MKFCNFCNTEKPLSEFHKRNSRKVGYVSKCKSCSGAAKRKYRLENVDMHREHNKRRVPGWSLSRYNEYVELQNNCCAICGISKYSERDWCADHNHETLEPRGLLCVRCNAGLGYFRDNPEYLQSAITYLNKWK